LKVTYTEEAVADIVEALTYLNERNPTAAAKLDADLAPCVGRLAEREFEGPVSRLRSGAVVRSWGVPPFRIYYQRHPDELLDSPRLPPEAVAHHPLKPGATGSAERLSAPVCL
jgi:plasmid stabilization system protein ParE